MAQFMSPGINITEIDLSTIVPSVSTTVGAIAGVFDWGPAEQAVLVSDQERLAKEFGKPTANNAETWWTAANYLGYSNKLYVSRAVSTNAYNAVAATANVANVQIKNINDFEITEPSLGATYLAIAKYPGAKGNSLRVSVCQSARQYRAALKSADIANNDVVFRFPSGKTYMNVIVTNLAGNTTHASDQANTIRTAMVVGDILSYGGNYYDANGSVQAVRRNITTYSSVKTIGAISVINSTAVGFAVSLSNKNTGYVTNATSNAWESSVIVRQWQYASFFSNKPGTTQSVADLGGSGDQMHMIVFDYDGAFTGVPGAVLEKFPNLSRATDAKSDQGEDLYWQRVVNQSSEYIWAVNPIWGNPDTTSASITPSTDPTPLTKDFVGGTNGKDEAGISPSDVMLAYDVFSKPEELEVDIILAGKATGGSDFELITNYLIDNICELRKDCIVVASPPKSYVVNNFTNALDKVLEWRESVNESSYAVLDSGYKYQYDKYNDRFWWVPLNGDIGGLIARVDLLRDAWWSPGGFNRGDIKNVAKLAWNPSQGDRDLLYVDGVNPVITIAGEGTFLYGDKTAQAKPSAFDRINVRRLFIVLEKAVAKAAKYTLFEFNDEFTRATFKNMVDPYLRDIMGRRGIQDFRVVCDTSNNTGEVIDRNEFIADIYIKPARSINFIQLNFIATKSGVAFEEIVGTF
jgi:hypothetical protein